MSFPRMLMSNTTGLLGWYRACKCSDHELEDGRVEGPGRGSQARAPREVQRPESGYTDRCERRESEGEAQARRARASPQRRLGQAERADALQARPVAQELATF